MKGDGQQEESPALTFSILERALGSIFDIPCIDNYIITRPQKLLISNLLFSIVRLGPPKGEVSRNKTPARIGCNAFFVIRTRNIVFPSFARAQRARGKVPFGSDNLVPRGMPSGIRYPVVCLIGDPFR